MNIDIAGVWRNLSWGCAYAGRPSLQIQLRDIGTTVEPKRPGLSIPFYKIPQIFGKQIRRYQLIQIHAVSFNAQGKISWIGDPLSQRSVYPLITSLLSDIENRIILHVNNQTDISQVDPRTNVVIAPVVPSVGNVEMNHWANLNYLTEDGEILFRVFDETDYDYVKRMNAKYHLDDRFTVHLAVSTDAEIRKQWSKQFIKDGLNAYLLPEIPFTPLPVYVDQSFRLPWL